MPESPYITHAPTTRRDSRRGIAFLERPGPGPVVVFLHGIGSSADSFLPLLDRFPSGPRLIAWNAPGYLASAPLEVDWPCAADYADALIGFFDDLGLRAAHVVGHSLGTLIAAAFGARAPNRVLSLTLAASAQGYGGTPGAPLPPAVATRVDDLAALGGAAFAAARAPRLVHAPEQNPSVVARVQAEMARVNPGGYGQAARMLGCSDLSGMMADLNEKPGFIVGAEDQITPLPQTEAARAAWQAAHGALPDCISIPEAGHAIYVQQPDAFAKALMRLVPDLESQTPTSAEGDRHAR